MFSCKVSQVRPFQGVEATNYHFSNSYCITGGDQSPALETHKSGNYNVLNLGPLITSKLRRSEDKDKDDILWLAQNKTDDVKAVADSIDKKKRIELAKEYDDDEQEDILKAFKLSKDDIDD